MLLECRPIDSYSPAYFTGMYSDRSIYFPMTWVIFHEFFYTVYLFGKCYLLFFLDFALYLRQKSSVLPPSPEKVMINHPNHRKSHTESSESS